MAPQYAPSPAADPPAADPPAADPPAADPPASALAALLPPDVDPATGRGLRHEAAGIVWHGVVWGRLGRGDLANAAFERVNEPTLLPWIAAERGRLLRELGGHAAAEALEGPALAIATDPVDRAMLHLSMAADAVGRGDDAVAERRLRAAREVLEVTAEPGPRADRQWLRASWVAIEIALLRGGDTEVDGWSHRCTDDSLPRRHGDPSRCGPVGLPQLDAAGGLQLPAAYTAGSRFHLAKGLLFAGVVRGEVRLLDLALDHAPPALWWAVQFARAAAGVTGAAAAGERARAAIVPLPTVSSLRGHTPPHR